MRRLLDYARDPGDARAARLDLRAPLAEAVALARAARRGRSIELEAREEPAWASGIEAEIVQIVLNLLLNAADAAGDGEAARVRASIERAPSGAARVLVRDNGPGVDPEHADLLFEPFFTTKPAGSGTGLGLAISARLAERSGAELRLIADPDWTIFELRFPVPQPDPDA